MERIQAAIQKAKETREAPQSAEARPAAAASRGGGTDWADLPVFVPDAGRMERARVVTFADANPAHAAFDMMRARLLRAAQANGWRSIGITSPTVGCGKTTVAMNLGFSLAHLADVRAVLVDLDLRRPVMAQELGIPGDRSVAAFLQGQATLAETFVRYGSGLAIGASVAPMRHSGDLLLGGATGQALAGLEAALRPDVILYDLPPLLVADDAFVFLEHLDAILLVAGAERSRLDEVDRCENDLAQTGKLLGVVLNMCRYAEEEYGYY
jgi:protein-tyrosine kinase